MILLLLLDAAPTQNIPTAVYVTLIVTLIASLIAAGTSFYASTKSSNTAKEVAILSAKTAQEIKDKEFKNEYYKKVLERRLKAIEYAERMVSIFTPFKRNRNQEKYHSFFLKENYESDFSKIIEDITLNSLWYNPKTFAEIKDLNFAIRTLIYELKLLTEENEKIVFLKNKFDDIRNKNRKVIVSISEDILVMHDVESFLIGRRITGNINPIPDIVFPDIPAKNIE